MKTKQSMWQVGVTSDKGAVRKANEDNAIFARMKIEEGKETAIAVVADGMGGYQAGDVASRLAIDMIRAWWDEWVKGRLDPLFSFKKTATDLNKRLSEINERLLNIQQSQKVKLGTTLSILLLFEGQYIISHVGDCRIYRKGTLPEQNSMGKWETAPLGRQGSFMQLTEDHSWVGSQVKLGRLSKEEARRHSKKNVLLQCLGIDRELTVFHTQGGYLPEDLFLLCSDGLHACFSDEELDFMLGESAEKSPDLQAMSDSFVYAANHSGATDNVTAMILRNRYRNSSNGTVNWKTGLGKMLNIFR